MIGLFFKIFILCLAVSLLFLSLKKLFSIFHPVWFRNKRKQALRGFIHQSIFDEHTIQKVLNPLPAPLYQEVHPNDSRLKTGRYKVKRFDLHKGVERFLAKQSRCRHMIIYGDSGAGKTSFLLNYYIDNRNRPSKQQDNIVIIPFGSGDTDQMISNIPDPNQCILFLDGLEEDFSAFKSPHQRVRDLMDLTRKFKRVVITAGLDVIPINPDLPAAKGYEIIEPKSKSDSTIYRLRRFYIAPFTIPRFKKSLNTRLSFWKMRKKKRINEYVQLNTSFQLNPLLLEFILFIIDDKLPALSKMGLYKTFIKKHLSLETQWQNKPELFQCLCHLSRRLYMQWLNQDEDTIALSEIEQLSKTWGISFKPFQFKEHSLIWIDRNQTVRFSHRSILEFLFVLQLLKKDKACYKLPLTVQMKLFLFDMLNSGVKVNLSAELGWLKRFNIFAQPLSLKDNGDSSGKSSIVETLIHKNPKYAFLTRLYHLFSNPIFYEFGWDPKLNQNLTKAVTNGESSLMKLDRFDWTVIINPTKIQINKAHEKNVELLINQYDFDEYRKIENDKILKRLNKNLGLNGLRYIDTINRTGKIAVIPDLSNADTFRIFFDHSAFGDSF